MNKIFFKIEYPMKSTVITALWRGISQPEGLCEWFADSLSVEDDLYTFAWDGHEQVARLLDKKAGSHIRFHWIDDANPDSFFEMRISAVELTGEVALIITDCTTPDEHDDAILLWNQQIETLKKRLGI